MRRAVFLIDSFDGTGTGFIIREDGLAVTAFHVVEGQRWARVLLDNGRLIDARVLAADIANDVALLGLNGFPDEEFPRIEVVVDDVRVGDSIAVYGYPIESYFATKFAAGDLSVNQGIVSSIRNRAEGGRVIQTDAVLNPGNSGGPMVDSSGRVVGVVVSAIVGRDIAGLGFATHFDHIQALIETVRFP